MNRFVDILYYLLSLFDAVPYINNLGDRRKNVSDVTHAGVPEAVNNTSVRKYWKILFYPPDNLTQFKPVGRLWACPPY